MTTFSTLLTTNKYAAQAADLIYFIPDQPMREQVADLFSHVVRFNTDDGFVGIDFTDYPPEEWLVKNADIGNMVSDLVVVKGYDYHVRLSNWVVHDWKNDKFFQKERRGFIMNCSLSWGLHTVDEYEYLIFPDEDPDVTVLRHRYNHSEYKAMKKHRGRVYVMPFYPGDVTAFKPSTVRHAGWTGLE